MAKKKHKSKSILPLLLLVIILGILLYGYYKYKKEDKIDIVLKDNRNIEVNSEVTINDFILDDKKLDIINKESVIDTSKVGKQLVKLIYKDNNKEDSYGFVINVIDTVSPVIKADDEIRMYAGNDIDLLEYMEVNDNSADDVTVNIIGEYNTNEEGEYNLKYEAIDKSNNKSEYAFVLKVIIDYDNRTFTTSKGFKGQVIDGVTYIDGVLIANKTYPLPSNYGYGLTSETNDAFSKMNNEATSLGLNIWLSSGYRSYSDQNYIYNNYVARDGREEADRYSARAGHSEHQTGLAFDLNTIDDSFSYTDEGKWVANNCYLYGFILRYPQGKEDITGYMYESWHLRYVGVELASKLYNNGDWITLEEYFGIDSKY